MLTVARMRPLQRKIVQQLIDREGGYVDHPADKGGPTNYGVTLAALRSYMNDQSLQADSVQNLTEDVARRILIDDYFVGYNFDLIDDVGAYEFVLDCSVNHGPRGAVIILQRAVEATEDGALGPMTAKAANELAHKHLMSALISRRGQWYARICKRDPSQIAFLEGWLNRLHSFLPY